MYISYNTTYNDLIKEFSQQFTVRQVEILKELRLSFKPYTGISVNSLVTVDNYPSVIQSFGSCGYDKGCFSSWLSRYKWRTPLQSECGDEGFNYSEWQDFKVQLAIDLERFDSDVDEEFDHDAVTVPEKPLKVIDVFTEAYGEGYAAWYHLDNFLKAGSYHRSMHPWTVLELSGIEVLKKWMGRLYPF
jgi:hypothetical protein